MKAIILINAYTTSEAELYQPRRICDELVKRGVQVEIRRNDGGLVYLSEREVVSRVFDCDFCVYLDKDKYAARMLEATGLRLFNRASAVEVCDDKMLTHIALAGVAPLPETCAGALCYTDGVPVTGLDRVQELGYPLVVKECYGSRGKQVYLARDREELNEIASRLQKRPHLFQKFIKESAGRDLRVIVIGGRAVGAMKRTGTDFRSNVGAGGRAEAAALDEAAKRISERVAQELKLDYCGVDLLYGKNGYLVCEVNSNAFFSTFERVTGENIAALYADYIVKTVNGL